LPLDFKRQSASANMLGLISGPGRLWRNYLGEKSDRAGSELYLFDLEKPRMTPIHSRRQRHPGFEALEGRLALSTGMGIPVSAHHAAVVMSQTVKSIPASFTSRVQILNSSELMTSNLKGKIGTAHFTGYATGTVAGLQFEGGSVYLSNNKGTVQLSLGPAFVVKAGKHPKQAVDVGVVQSSGKYLAYAGRAGVLTTWNVPARPNAIANFSGYFVV
jgi:hypothetical protein